MTEDVEEMIRIGNEYPKLTSINCECGCNFLIKIDRSVSFGNTYLYKVDEFLRNCPSCGKEY